MGLHNHVLVHAPLCTQLFNEAIEDAEAEAHVDNVARHAIVTREERLCMHLHQRRLPRHHDGLPSRIDDLCAWLIQRADERETRAQVIAALGAVLAW